MSSSPTPPAVVLVHGMRTSSAIWAPQLRYLHDAGHDAVAVDLPAHGARHEDRFTLPAAFDVVDDAVRSFGPGRPVALVGLSLGGYTSLAYAAREASRAGTSSSRLVGVVAAACCSDPRGKPVALFRDVAHATVGGLGAARRGTRAALARLRAGALGGRSRAPGTDVPAIAGDTTAPETFRPGWQVVTDALTQLAGRSSVADLRAARVPVWLVNGARDRLRLEEQRHLAAAADGTLVVVPGAGHDVNSHAPEAFNRVLSQALRDFGRG
ncbi:alpha/beta hydrolase [Xylanimonas oleitrophica]|uniref:Alpha/beta hydrolase n=1 Tax=Xylanimonas oleitrophica TaxID=2607479 RepID=A0A2W5Y8V8_9MICO|nr:alpha/beta hydrolase [Xylanimonas oleitrophica]PZR54984.1 alpha/beta hydrolase [Xylanimonas oleitrophica]